MDDRARFAIGGAGVLAASVAAVAFVAATNATALTLIPGQPIGAPGIVLPSPAAESQSAQVDRLPAAGDAPVAAPPVVVVPAPEPVVVVPAEPAGPSPADEAALIAAAGSSGSWDSAVAWATARGWSQDKVDALIARLQSKVDRLGLAGDAHTTGAPGQNERGPANPQSGLVPGKSAEHRSNNGSNGNGNGNGSDTDRSRESPDSRDR